VAEASTRKNSPATAETPAARPSMLSIRLRALVMPTIQNSVMSRLSTGQGKRSTRMPTAATMPPATTSAARRTHGESPRRSSSRPTTARSVAPMPTPIISTSAGPMSTISTTNSSAR
jgi:hypothetical protein